MITTNAMGRDVAMDLPAETPQMEIHNSPTVGPGRPDWAVFSLQEPPNDPAIQPHQPGGVRRSTAELAAESGQRSVTAPPSGGTLRVLITGSRAWTDRAAIAAALRWAIASRRPMPAKQHVTVVHGAARGADILAASIALAWGVHVEAHPADWDHHGRRAGPVRNAAMVALGADVLLAFPLGESRGTYNCVRLAREAGIPVFTFTPDSAQKESKW